MSTEASTSSPTAGPKTLRLHVWGTTPTLPALDPTSLYAASLLQATFARNDNVTLQFASASTSLPRVPLLQVLNADGETVQLVNEADAIRAYCAAAGLDVALASNQETGAKAAALHALLDDQMLDLTLHSLFSLPANFRTVTAPAYSSVGGVEASASSSTLLKLATLPLRLQPSIPSRLRNVVETRLTAAGLWGLGGKEASAQSGEADELAARAGIVPAKKRGLGQGAKDAARDEFERSKLVVRSREVLDVVDAALNGGTYLLGGERLASLDAKVFALLAPLLFTSPELPVQTLPRLIKTSYPSLATYLTTIKEELFPTDSVAWISPEEARSSPPVLESTSRDSSFLSYFWPTITSSNKASSTTFPLPGHRMTNAAPRPPRRSNSPAPEDWKLRLGRIVWICSALVGLVGYAFASGMPATEAVDFAQHDPSIACASPLSPISTTSRDASGGTCPRMQYIVTGTFNSPDLFVLSYDAMLSELEIKHTVAGEGPHQFLALGVSKGLKQTVYATTWGSPSTLSAWHVSDTDYNLTFGNRKQITATGSYVHVQPPPYSTSTAPGFGSLPGISRWLGSAGGPTGELHKLDPETGRIGDMVQELVFLPGGKEELVTADKSRKALRYGAHSFDCSANRNEAGETIQQVAFVADLGANAVQAYTFPNLDHLYTVPSARDNDGPRHSIPHPDLPLLFTVTEHTNYVDVYQIPPPNSNDGTKWLGSFDMLTPTQAQERHEYRGDTLRFSSDLNYLFATTRGKSPSTKGLLLSYRLQITPPTTTNPNYAVTLTEVSRYTTRTSGGKANAIELSPHPSSPSSDLIVLTDDEQGFLDILTFNPHSNQFLHLAYTQLPPLQNGSPQGASHAIWLL